MRANNTQLPLLKPERGQEESRGRGKDEEEEEETGGKDEHRGKQNHQQPLNFSFCVSPLQLFLSRECLLLQFRTFSCQRGVKKS